MTAAARKVFDRPNISAIAEQELAAANNDVEAAIAARVARIEDDGALFHVLVQTALYDLCAQAVQGVLGRRRRIIWDESPADRRRRSRARAGAGRRHVFYTLLDFQLPGGKPLGDARYAEIKRTSERYLKHAKTYAHEGRWLKLVADVMREHPREVVRQVEERAQSTVREPSAKRY
jgi:hypothetical protein